MLNMKSMENKFQNAIRNIDSFTGASGYAVHAAGEEKPLCVVSLNTCNATTTCVNHTLKSVILGAEAPISIASLGNGYSMVLFRHAAMMTAMLVNPKGFGKPACMVYANEARAPFHHLDTKDYIVYKAVKFDRSRAGKELLNSISNALTHRVEMSSNSFKLFLDDAEIADFMNLVNNFKGVRNELQ